MGEAVKAVNTALNRTHIPEKVQKILNDDQCTHLKEKNPFWVIARAVKEFVNKEGNGALPLRGSLPDMTSDSQRYIALQNGILLARDCYCTDTANKLLKMPITSTGTFNRR